MDELKKQCENLDAHERLHELDMVANDLVFFHESGIEFAGKYGLEVNDVKFFLGDIYTATFDDLLGETSEDTVLRRSDNSWGKNIGGLMKEINRIYVRANDGTRSRIGMPNEAVESAIKKIITHNECDDNLTLRTSESSPGEICLEILRSTSLPTQKKILKVAHQSRSLIEKLEEPLMTTTLWEHQHEALMEWLDNDFFGYVDMGTATGKTVLGLAALSLLYGELHPNDQTSTTKGIKKRDGKVLIVAHDHLILEQWGREMNEHLSITKGLSELSKEEELSDIKLDWGTVEFTTSDKLRRMIDEGKDISRYDLLVMDEIHKYSKIINSISHLIENRSIRLMALSGSIDTNKSTRKEVRNRLDRYLPLLKKYTLEEAKSDGIIPEFSWTAIYAHPQIEREKMKKLKETTKKCKEGFEQLQEIEDLPEFSGYEDAVDYSKTIEGRNLQNDLDVYREFVRTFRSRGTRIWNLNPSLDSMGEVLKEEAKEKKCLTLVWKKDHIRKLREMLISESCISESDIYTIGIEGRKPHEQRSIIDEFDKSDGHGVLIGTGKRLGTGIDIPHLEVVVNATSGYKANKSLVQRMGRMLRNPEGQKEEPEFYNIIPIIDDQEASMMDVDGRRLVEGGTQYLALADEIRCEPSEGFVFSTDEERIENILAQFERAGVEYIQRLKDEDSYQLTTVVGKDNEDQKSSKTYLEEVLTEDVDKDESVLLKKWGKRKPREKTKVETKVEKKEEHKTHKHETPKPKTGPKKEKRKTKKRKKDSFVGNLKEKFKKIKKKLVGE